jgi:hypothetical protein
MQANKIKFKFNFEIWSWTLLAGVIFTEVAWSQDAGLDRAKAVLERNWELEESMADDEVLYPPQADGHMSLHDGVIMISMHRETKGSRKSNYGYGTYSLTREAWSFGYDHYVTFDDTGSAIAANGAPFTGQRNYQLKMDGDKLIANSDSGTWTFIFYGDAMTYLGKGKPIRKWHRMPVN